MILLSKMMPRFLAFVLVFLATFGTAIGEPSPPAKIGVILPMSGNLAPFGEGFRRGIELALAQPENNQLTAVFEDDQSENRAATVAATHKLIDQDQVSAMLLLSVHTVAPIAPILNRKQIPALILWDSNHLLANAGEYIFGFGIATEATGADMASFIYSRGKRRLGIAGTLNEWSHIISAAFKQRFQELGGEISLEEYLELSTNDFRAVIARLKNKQVEGVYVPSYGPALVTFIKQARELGFTGEIYTGDGLSSAEIAMLGPRSSADVFATQLYENTPWFREALEKKHPSIGKDSVFLGMAALGYDAVYCLAKAAAETPKPITGRSLREHLATTTCSGLSGTVAYASGRLSDKRERILQVINSQLVPALP